MIKLNILLIKIFINLNYYYISNSNSSTIGYKKNEKSVNRLLYSFFLFLKFILFYTKNNKYEKGMANAFVEKEMKVILTSEMCSIINNNFKFYESILIYLLKILLFQYRPK